MKHQKNKKSNQWNGHIWKGEVQMANKYMKNVHHL
jgi:hypothetical protein